MLKAIRIGVLFHLLIVVVFTIAAVIVSPLIAWPLNPKVFQWDIGIARQLEFDDRDACYSTRRTIVLFSAIAGVLAAHSIFWKWHLDESQRREATSQGRPSDG